MGGSLKLVKDKNNSKSGGRWNKCPNAKFYYQGIVETKEGEQYQVSGYSRCKSWSCPYCSKLNQKQLSNDFVSAVVFAVDEVKKRHSGNFMRYWLKHVTLTLPGKAFREIYSQEQMEMIIKYRLNRLLAALRHRFGKFEYVWSDEQQRDGTPHIHLVVVGENIGDRKFLPVIERLWKERYGMGYVQVEALRADGEPIAVARYLAKYAGKGMAVHGKNMRVWGMSKDLRKAITVKPVMFTLTGLWELQYDEVYREVLIEVPFFDTNKIEVRDGPDYFDNRVFEDLCSFFEEMGRSTQLELFRNN